MDKEMLMLRIGILSLVVIGVTPTSCIQHSPKNERSDEITQTQKILEASKEAMGVNDHPISSISIIADCIGPTGPFTTRVISTYDGRMLFEQTRSSTSTQMGISQQGTWRRSESGFERADTLTLTFLHGHDLHMLAIAPMSRYSNPEYIGVQRYAGESSYVIQFTDVLDGAILFYYSLDTSLPLGMKMVNHSGYGDREIFVYFEEWESIDSIQLFKKATFLQGEDEYLYSYRSIEYNIPEDRLPVIRIAEKITG